MLCYVTPKEHLGLPNRKIVEFAARVPGFRLTSF